MEDMPLSEKQLDKETLKLLLDKGVITQAVHEKLLNDQYEKEGVLNLTSQSMKDVVKNFELYLKDEYSQNTAEGYSINVRNFIEFINETPNNKEETELIKISRNDIDRWFLRLASNGYTFSSIRRFKHSIKKFFEYISVEFPNYDTPSIDDIVLPSISEGYAEVDALEHDEVINIADHAANVRNKAMIQFMYETGMRRQELIDLKQDDVDFDKRHVKIYDAQGNLDRVGQFSTNTLILLKEYLADWEHEIKEVNEVRLQRSRESNKPYQPIHNSKYLFQTIRSPQVSYSTIFKAIKDASFEYFLNTLVEEGLPEEEAKIVAEERSAKINTETLRHSRRAFLFSEGKTIEQVQAIMGDENRHVCRRYLKIAQRIYPEKFFNEG